ncbi:Cholera toxin secretion protein epsL [Serratia quinivorans]|nr:Cholera toxin secretion protein epsL [Serratia quinivorans]
MGRLENAQALHELQPLASESQLILLIPSKCVLFRSVTFNGRYSPRHQQALAWQLEPFCLGDVEQLHITLLQQQGENYALAAVEKTLMRQWLSDIKNAGLSPTLMMPDVLALPYCASGWSCVQLGQRWLVRQTENSGFCADEESLAFILTQAVPPPTLHPFSPAPSIPGHWRDATECTPLALLSQGAELCKTNLLHSEFSQPSTLAPRRLKRMIAPLLFGYLLTYAVEPLVASYLARQHTAQLRQQTQQLYQHYFPGQTLEKPPQQQLPHQLEALEKNSPSPGLIALLATSQPLLQQLGTDKVSVLHWQNGALTFHINADENWLRQQTRAYPLEGTTIQVGSAPSGASLTLFRSQI